MISAVMTRASVIIALGLVVSATLVHNEILAQASPSRFVELRLPDGISVEVPRTWIVLDAQGHTLVETTIQAILDLTRLPVVQGKLSVAARSPAPTYASMNIVVNQGPAETQAQIRSLSSAQLREEDSLLHSVFKAVGEQAGWTIVEWLGTRKVLLDGRATLLSEYRRQFPGKPIVHVGIHSVPLGTKVVALTLEHREEERGLWYPVLARIRQSLKLGQ